MATEPQNPLPEDRNLARLSRRSAFWALVFLLVALHPVTFSVAPEPDAASRVAPATYAPTALAAPYVVAETLRLWLWPYDNDGIYRAVDPVRFQQAGLMFALVFVLALRHAWRLCRYQVWLFRGLTTALILSLPTSGLIAAYPPDISNTAARLPGVGLAMLVVGLLWQGVLAWRRPLRWQNALLRVMSLALVAWLMSLPLEALRRHNSDRLEVAALVHRKPIAVVEYVTVQLASDDITVAEARRLLTAAQVVIPWYAGLPKAWETLHQHETEKRPSAPSQTINLRHRN